MISYNTVILILAITTELVLSQECSPEKMLQCLTETKASESIQEVESIEEVFEIFADICGITEQAKPCMQEFPMDCLDGLPGKIKEPIMELITHENIIEFLEADKYCNEVSKYFDKFRSLYKCGKSLEQTEEHQNNKKYGEYIEIKFGQVVPPICCSLKKLVESKIDESATECDEFSISIIEEASKPIESYINTVCGSFDPSDETCQEYFSEID